MKLDITKVIEKLPTTMKGTSIDPVRPRSKKQATAYPTLGDVARFQKFPDIVDKEFISMYRNDLDAFLVPYIQYGEMTVSKAHKFIENLVEQIFGNEKHYGIFSYLKERNYENSADRELVRTSERLINSGWRVLKDKNTQRYKIINNEGTTVIDATGASEFFEETAGILMNESSAHLFLDSSTAARIESLARAVNMDADSLTMVDSLESLLIHTKDKKLQGYILNYKKLKSILARGNSYPTLTRGESFSNLYENGFILSDRMIFSQDSRVIMTNNMDSYLIYPINAQLNQNNGAHKDLLAFISSNIKSEIFKNINNVTPQVLKEIKDLTRTVALMSEYWDDERVLMSYADTVDSLRRMDSYVKSGEISKDFYNRVFSSFAALVVTEVILLGNNWLSLSSMGFDPIQGRFYAFSSRDAFTIDEDSLVKFIQEYKGDKAFHSFSPFTSSVYPFRLSSPASLSILIENLPREYFSAIQTISTKVEGYPVNLDGVTNYMRKAIDFILSRGK
jgi:hypothetical protein